MFRVVRGLIASEVEWTRRNICFHPILVLLFLRKYTTYYTQLHDVNNKQVKQIEHLHDDNYMPVTSGFARRSIWCSRHVMPAEKSRSKLWASVWMARQKVWIGRQKSVSRRTFLWMGPKRVWMGEDFSVTKQRARRQKCECLCDSNSASQQMFSDPTSSRCSGCCVLSHHSQTCG